MKRRRVRPIQIVLLIVALAFLGAAIFLIVSGKKIKLPGAGDVLPVVAPVTITQPVKAFVFDVDAQLNQSESTVEQHKAAIEGAVAFAAENGFGAILWEGGTAESQNYRKTATKAAPFITEHDDLLIKWDPLEFFCRVAAKKDIAAFMCFDAASITNEEAVQLGTKYPVSGVYIDNGDMGQQFGSYTKAGAEDTLVAITPISEYLPLVALAKESEFGGVVFGNYSELANSLGAYSVLASVFNKADIAPGLEFAPQKKLGLSYPTDTSQKLYTESCFIMGTSDPARGITLNGAEIVRHGTDGTFGVQVSLNVGTNAFVLEQEGEKVEFSLLRAKSTYVPNPNAADATAAADAGQVIEITSGIASALSDPASDDNINETIKMGARASVVKSVRTSRNGKKTWAYQLESGDYVLARNTKIAQDTARASFTDTTLEKTDNGETFTFGGAGTPLVYTLREENVLTLTFYGADFGEGFNFEGSQFITAAEKTVNDKATVIKLTLNAENALWGWDIIYKDGTTQLFLKAAPKQSAQFALPLSGIRVILDAGHGGNDGGAMGSAGTAAPVEKDANLAVALSAKQYLEQMGATVILARGDDTFKTLDERLNMTNTEQPDFFVSVHHNSVELTVDANESTGTECYYFYKWHKPLAQALTTLVANAGERENRGEKYGYYYVTRSTAAPSVLLETGFMVNPAEYEKVTDNYVIDKEGAAIAKAIFDCVPKT